MDGITFDGVSVIRDDRSILDDISLSLTERRIAVLGANGSGKSTLLRLINGLMTADTGAVSVYGMDPARQAAAVRRKVGFVFQNPEAQIIMPTIDEEMELGLKALGLPPTTRRERAESALERFGLSDRHDGSAHMLSGGEKRRLTLACIFAMDPEVIVMDEPTSMLDLPGTMQFSDFLSAMPQQVVLATHDLSLAARCERVVVLHKGRVIADGTADAAVGAYRDLVGDLVAGGTPP